MLVGLKLPSPFEFSFRKLEHALQALQCCHLVPNLYALLTASL